MQLFEEISDLDDDDYIEANDHKSMNQNEHEINTKRKEDFICPCSSSSSSSTLTEDNNSGRCSKAQNSQSSEVTSSNATKQDQNQQKVVIQLIKLSHLIIK